MDEWCEPRQESFVSGSWADLLLNVSERGHIPVLLAQCVQLLDPKAGEVVVDCTAGLGGHAAALAARLGGGASPGTVVLFDLDPGNLERATARVREAASGVRVIAHHGSFADVGRVLAGVEGGLRADVVLADLGFASVQMDDAARGFSFMREGPLDMRLNPKAPVTAAELVNTLSAPELMEILRDLGEEPAARVIAQKIVQARQAMPISTTAQLASVIRSVVPRRPGMTIDPATKTFQALRIAVNDELGHLDRLLDAVARGARAASQGSWLSVGARVGIISFHSLEDRRVKQACASMVEQGLAEHVTRKPVTPEDLEVGENPRSRSAKLRVIRIGQVGGAGAG